MSGKVAVLIYLLAVAAGVGLGFIPKAPAKKAPVDIELENAVKAADVDGVKRTIAMHPNLDAKFSETAPPILQEAIGMYCRDFTSTRYWAHRDPPKNGKRFQIIRLLLEAGANLNIEQGCITSALAIGDVELMTLLISHGAKVRYRKEDQYTYYHLALGQPDLVGFEKCLEMAIGVGYELNHRDSSGRTKMHAMAQSGGIEMSPGQSIVEIMVKHGMDINAKDCLGMTPYDYATNDKQREWLAKMGAKPSQ